MDFNADHFELFGLVRAFRIEQEKLERTYRELQAQVHPDRFASAGESERRLSLQWATRVNEAYSTLRMPLSRAQYLLNLAGHKIDAENNTAMPEDFLLEQMEWREAVFEARSTQQAGDLEQLYHRVKQRIKRGYEQLGSILDVQHDYAEAVDVVRRLMFLERLLADIDDAMAELEQHL